MAVIRVEKNRNFTTMSNYHLRDKDLSLKAKGLLSQILSLPDDWDYSVRGLASICLEGKDCIVTTLKELEIKGYLVRKQLRDANGRLGGIEYIIYETPPKPCADSPCTETAPGTRRNTPKCSPCSTTAAPARSAEWRTPDGSREGSTRKAAPTSTGSSSSPTSSPGRHP